MSVAFVAVVVVSAMAATGSASPAVALQATGHWVFNRTENQVAHVDGGTNLVDARVAVPTVGSAPLFTLQGEKQGFVVGRQAVTVFGRSTLTVETSFPTAGPEIPVGIEVLGGPYLVYRQAGTIVRLGVPPTSIPVGGPLGRPTYTDDGTVWLHRTDNGAICALRRGADALDCSTQTSAGLAGSLTVVSTSAAFVDTAHDAAQVIGVPTSGTAVPIGVDLPEDSALIADRDVQGRLPVVVPGPNRLLLVDSAGIPGGRAGSAPISANLVEGTFSSPVASGGVIAVVEQTRNQLFVFAVDGQSLGVTNLPPGEGPASITRGGDGRIYVDDADGAATHVIGVDGKVTSVATGGAVQAVTAAPPQLAALVVPPPPHNPPPSRGDPVITPGGPPPPARTNPQPPPSPPPSAPTAVTASLGPNGSVTVAWNPADGHGLPVNYSVTTSGAAAVTTSGTSATLNGLARGSSHTFVVTASTSAGTSPASAPSKTVTIPDLLRVTTTDLPEATRGSTYATTLAAAGGIPPYRWSVSGGGLPAGLRLGTGGQISGTPTSVGSLTFTARVDDSAGGSATRQMTLSFANTNPIDVFGDLNGDRKVGCLDVNILKSQYGKTGAGLSGDLNSDKVVNIADLSIILSHYTGDGTGSSPSCDP